MAQGTPQDFQTAEIPQGTPGDSSGSLLGAPGCSPEPVPSLCPQSMWKTQRSTVKGYFLAGGQMVWWPVSSPVLPCPRWQTLLQMGINKQNEPNTNQTEVCVLPAPYWLFSPDLRVQGEAQPNGSLNLADSGDFQNSLRVPSTDTALC